MALETNVQKSALDNRYLVLRQKGQKKAILVDMQAKINRPLPVEVANKSTKEILTWAKATIVNN
ncbi:MAG: hypothetical protein AAGJ18_12795, partial [Bacteroidota bacterium]